VIRPAPDKPSLIGGLSCLGIAATIFTEVKYVVFTYNGRVHHLSARVKL
jgi:hypothetical protein